MNATVRWVDQRKFMIYCGSRRFLVEAKGFKLSAYCYDLFYYDILKEYLRGKFYFINGFCELKVLETDDNNNNNARGHKKKLNVSKINAEIL